MAEHIPNSRLIYLVAGEQSGDVLGARLIEALRALRPDLHFAGIGGPRMEEHGLETLFPMRDLAVMGLLEVLPRVLKLRRRLLQADADIRARRPAALVTIDSPGFTLRLLRRLEGAAIPRIHYVAPQVWAWHEERVRKFPGLWEKLLCLLPFEPEFFARHGLAADFVGHPVLQSGADLGDAARFRARHALAPDARVLILMPGSRQSEVPRLLPVFRATLERLAPRFPGLVPVVPAASAVAEAVHRATADWPIPPLVVTDLDDKHDAYAAASAALTKSGTSTLELALAGVPMAVTYRVNPLTAAIARRMIKVPYVSILNLLAGREAVPELLQENCTPAKLAATVTQLMTDPAVRETQLATCRDILAHLAPASGSPASAAAHAILGVVEQQGR